MGYRLLHFVLIIVRRTHYKISVNKIKTYSGTTGVVAADDEHSAQSSPCQDGHHKK